eukprot:3353924-Pleurochrysis_carterae.AAC.1
MPLRPVFLACELASLLGRMASKARAWVDGPRATGVRDGRDRAGAGQSAVGGAARGASAARNEARAYVARTGSNAQDKNEATRS